MSFCYWSTMTTSSLGLACSLVDPMCGSDATVANSRFEGFGTHVLSAESWMVTRPCTGDIRPVQCEEYICHFVASWRIERPSPRSRKVICSLWLEKTVHAASFRQESHVSPRLRVWTRQMLHNNRLGLEDARLNISRIGFNSNRKLRSDKGRR